MHISVEHKQLQKALELIARVSTKHLTLPVLQCVLIESKNSTLTFKATNLEVGITYTCPVSEKEGGSVAVAAHTLLQIVSLISQKDVTLRTDEGSLIVETSSSKSSLNIIEATDFPHIPAITTNPQKINGTVFALGIKTAAFAASQSSIKPELGSVYVFQKKEHTLTFVATDSFRLMEKTTPQQHIVFNESILIPHKNALELAHVCEVVEDDPKLLVDENQCALQFENVYITSRLTNGTFPDYEQIIPKEYSTHSTLLTKDLQNALKKTNIFLNKFMQLSISVRATEIELKAHSGEVGATVEKIHANTDGDDISLNFNQRYIQEALPYITDDSLTMHFAGIGRPLVLESVHDRSVRYLVMPMNK